MQDAMSRYRGMVVLTAMMGLVGCGKDSNPVAPSTPAPAPPAPVTSVVSQGSQAGLDPRSALVVVFTTAAAGTLNVTVDWTFASNDVDVFLTRGDNPCSVQQLNDNTCLFVGSSTSTTNKPERLSLASQPAGIYTLYIPNFGTTTEALSFLVQLTSTPGTSSLARTQGAVAGPRLSKGVLAGLARR